MEKVLGIILGGILGFVLGNANKLFIDPVINLRKVICECRYILVFRENYIANPASEDTNEYFQKKRAGEFDEANLAEYVKAEKELREAAAKLKISIDGVIGFWFFAGCRLLPKKTKLIKASNIMIRLSNSLLSGKCEENVKDKDSCELFLLNKGKLL